MGKCDKRLAMKLGTAIGLAMIAGTGNKIELGIWIYAAFPFHNPSIAHMVGNDSPAVLERQG